MPNILKHMMTFKNYKNFTQQLFLTPKVSSKTTFFINRNLNVIFPLLLATVFLDILKLFRFLEINPRYQSFTCEVSPDAKLFYV